VKFGVVICADGGYVEPSRILALKGARVIFAPPFNYIGKEGLLRHFQQVRADHVARAVENGVWFARGNNVVLGKDPAITRYEGVGYGDSYIVDPHGEILVRSRRHQEDFLFADIDPRVVDSAWGVGRSLHSIRELHRQLLEAAAARQ
jgi:predicted amidohydrolase